MIMPSQIPASPSMALGPYGQAPMIGNTQKINLDSDKAALDYFAKARKECFSDRWIYERKWTRNIHYVDLRQWLGAYSRSGGWQEPKLGRGVPRPVTAIPKTSVQAIRSLFTSVKFAPSIRPTSQNPDSVTTAATADRLIPLLYDVHEMSQTMLESDWNYIVLGNTVLHTWWDSTAMYGSDEIPYEQCATCGQTLRSDQIAQGNQTCPHCQGAQFSMLMDPATGKPKADKVPHGCARTTALSPLEIAFPLQRPRWADVEKVIRLRWRTREEYEADPELDPAWVKSLQWQRTPTERSLQIFRSLPLQDETQARPATYGLSGGSSEEGEGLPEYELWCRPSAKHPEGYVLRVVGDGEPKIVHKEQSEGLPGNIPYHDSEGRPLFTFAHAAYEHNGGRVLGSGALDPAIPDIDALNRYDSVLEMIQMRMGSPQWIVPNGVDTQWLGEAPGLPGMVLKFNSLIAGTHGEPKRLDGIGPTPSAFQLRELKIRAIEEAIGMYDILKGNRPLNVEAFSALQLLKEEGQSRFGTALRSRANLLQEWATFALELERQFGPDVRTLTVMSPTTGYAFQTYKKADLKGAISIVLEDGSLMSKTSLGRRATIQHLHGMQAINLADPEQMFAVFQAFGEPELAPGLNSDMQSALKKQKAFEDWVLSGAMEQAILATNGDPVAMEMLQRSPAYPLSWKMWYHPEVHRTQWLRWCNSDKAAEIFKKYPEAVDLAAMHLQLIAVAIHEKMLGVLDPSAIPEDTTIDPPPPGAGPKSAPKAPEQAGAARAMQNSNQESGAVDTLPGGPSMQDDGQAPI